MFLNDRSEGSKNARTRPSQRLTLAGFGAAISVMSIILSFYVRPLKLVFRIVTVMGLMLPLTKGYYKEYNASIYWSYCNRCCVYKY